MKAIIEVAQQGSIFAAATQQIAASRRGKAPDFRLSFESARSLFSELTPARLDLMDTISAAVEQLKIALIDSAVAHLIENLDEGFIVLAEHRLEFDQRCSVAIPQCSNIEKERSPIGAVQVIRDLGFLHHWRQLMEIAEQHKPHAAERFTRLRTVETERLVDRRHQV